MRGLGGPLEVRGTEVECSAALLHSNDVFVLLEGEKGKAYVWVGSGASREEEDIGFDLIDEIQGPRQNGQKSSELAKMAVEGEESERFWALIGGKLPYANAE